MQYDLIIDIDPAGIGSNGIVIYSNETNNIVFNETFKAKTVLESKNLYNEYFLLTKKHFINQKILVIVEDCFLSSKQLLTNQLENPKIIGSLILLVQDVFNWDYLENNPKNKNKIENYKGNIKLTKHEQDAYNHIQYYLRNFKNERQSKLCEINSKN